MKNLPDITNWTESDLKSILANEDDVYEYKSSRSSLDELKNKISIAASAFWNSGGGVFIAGVDDSGCIDGGIPKTKGRQDIRDWIDNAIKLTEPVGNYAIQIIEGESPDSEIEKDKVVAVICFYESGMVPHMAYDKRYYVRIGAHTGAAGHFLTESLRAFRSYIKPTLKGIMKYHPTKPDVEQLVIIAINDAVALDVKLSFSPLPKVFHENYSNNFPLEIPAIDKQNPFLMEISGFGYREQSFGEKPVDLILEYKDSLGKNYRTVQEISPHKNLQPMSIGNDVFEDLVKAIESLVKKLK